MRHDKLEEHHVLPLPLVMIQNTSKICSETLTDLSPVHSWHPPGAPQNSMWQASTVGCIRAGPAAPNNRWAIAFPPSASPSTLAETPVAVQRSVLPPLDHPAPATSVEETHSHPPHLPSRSSRLLTKAGAVKAVPRLDIVITNSFSCLTSRRPPHRPPRLPLSLHPILVRRSAAPTKEKKKEGTSEVSSGVSCAY